MAKIHKIDPNADTVIILKNPLADFAVWNSPDEKAPIIIGSVLPVGLLDEERSTEGSDVEPSEPDDSSDEIIQYHVSSSVLKLASPHFERMLTRGDWKEGTPHEDDGRYHIVVQDWDEEASLVLLNALHLRNRQVPRSLSLEMLAKIALLVEYYNCAETVELWTEIWIKDLTPSIQLEPSRNLFLWMYIAWVFQLPNEFTRTTAVAIERCTLNELSISNLPIGRFVDRIAQARILAIRAVIYKLYDLQRKYRSMDYSCSVGECSFECGSILYGALTKGIDSLNLPFFNLPFLTPDQSFSAYTFQEICIKVRNMKWPKWYTSSSKSHYLTQPSKNYTNTHLNNYCTHFSCDPTNRIKEITEEVQNTIKGLQLTDFARI